MSKIYIASFDDGGDIKWGLFYDDAKEVRIILTEDFKQVMYDNEKEAETKLEEIEAERHSENGAAPFSLEEAQLFAEHHDWKYASTYAKTAPHEYLMKKWLSAEDRSLFERFIATIKANAVIGYFYGHLNKYLILGNNYYWFMPLPDNLAAGLINRTTTDFLEFRDGAYYYKPRE